MSDDAKRKVKACPNCNSGQTYKRKTRPPEHRWLCRECGNTFRQPKVRDRKHFGGSLKGHAKALQEKDPDDI